MGDHYKAAAGNHNAYKMGAKSKINHLQVHTLMPHCYRLCWTDSAVATVDYVLHTRKHSSCPFPHLSRYDSLTCLRSMHGRAPLEAAVCMKLLSTKPWL